MRRSISRTPAMPDPVESDNKQPVRKAWFGLDRRRRFKIYRWSALLLLVGAAGWALWYLRPERWYSYTDQVAFEQVARDVKPGFVLWDKAEPAGEGIAPDEAIGQPTISSDGTRMVYVAGESDGNANLFLRRWDGTTWGAPRPMRALNSSFHETAPALSGDGNFLFFSSDRPGGRGGKDIWVSRWDGVEYAWPLPLTDRVNSAFDEIDPAFSPDGLVLYFASNRPVPKTGQPTPSTEGLTRGGNRCAKGRLRSLQRRHRRRHPVRSRRREAVEHVVFAARERPGGSRGDGETGRLAQPARRRLTRRSPTSPRSNRRTAAGTLVQWRKGGHEIAATCFRAAGLLRSRRAARHRLPLPATRSPAA